MRIRKLKIVKYFILATLVVISTVGMTAFAATSGSIYGSLSGNHAYASLYNRSDGKRFCQVTILEYGTNANMTSTVAINSGTMSAGNHISTDGTISKLHVKAIGSVYNSESSYSGVGASYSTQIK